MRCVDGRSVARPRRRSIRSTSHTPCVAPFIAHALTLKHAQRIVADRLVLGSRNVTGASSAAPKTGTIWHRGTARVATSHAGQRRPTSARCLPGSLNVVVRERLQRPLHSLGVCLTRRASPTVVSLEPERMQP